MVPGEEYKIKKDRCVMLCLPQFFLCYFLAISLLEYTYLKAVLCEI